MSLREHQCPRRLFIAQHSHRSRKMTAARTNRASNESRALEHTVEANEDLSPEAINHVLDNYTAERWGEFADLGVPNRSNTEFRSLSDDKQTQYWMEHAQEIGLEHSADSRKSAREFTAVVFNAHHHALDQRDTEMDDISTDSGKAQYIQNATDRATVQHFAENFTTAMLQGDWQQANQHYKNASQVAIDAEHKFDEADHTQMYILDPSIHRAHYAAIIHIDWMEAETALKNLESNGAQTQHLRTLAQVTQRSSVNYIMPGINDEPEVALAPDTVEAKLSELHHAPQHFLQLLENRLDYTPVPGTEFPNLPADSHADLTSQDLTRYIAQLHESTELSFQTTWAPAIQYLTEQASTLQNMESSNFSDLEALTAAHRQIAYHGAQAIDALLHPADHYDTEKADDHEQKRREAMEAGISAMHQLGYSDEHIVDALASASFPNGYISSRNSEITEWANNNAIQVLNAEQTLDKYGFVDYLRSEQGDAVNRRNDDVHHAITYNPNGQVMHLVQSLAQAEAKLLDNLETAVQNLDYRSIDATRDQLAELNADYEPVESIQRRRAEEHEAEVASYNLQAHNMIALSEISAKYAVRTQNSTSFDTMLGVHGVERLIHQIPAGRYTGHDGDISTLQQSAQRWQEQISQ